jgi:poly(hydroxyalkanoate) depolymerase family esterase
MVRRLILAGSLVLLAAAVALGVSDARDGPGAPLRRAASGTVEQRSFPHGYRALMYTPATLDRSRPAPLVVMLHGCNASAEQFEAATALDVQAARDHFVVMYPDAAGRPDRCWHAATDTTRASGDPAAIAGMVRDALAHHAPAIDPARVYVAGTSSGASLTSVLGATYPDVFAAIAVDAGCAYGVPACGGSPPSLPTGRLARDALRAMGTRARVMPLLVMEGDRDDVVPDHSGQVLDQWRMTDDLVASGTTTRPIVAMPSRTREVAAAGRYPSTVERYDAAPRCPVLERWTIHGMGHAWPGGTEDPDFDGFTDVRGPIGGDVIWSFFRQFRNTDRPNPCPAQAGVTN